MRKKCNITTFAERNKVILEAMKEIILVFIGGGLGWKICR